MLRPRLALATVASVFVLTACTGADETHPRSEQDGASKLVSEPASSEDKKVCEPGAHEICFLSVSRPDGTVDCPESIRFCAKDGTHWHACGHYDVTDDGFAVPPSDDTPPPPPAE